MRKVMIIAVGLSVVAAAATYVRYWSFDPCDWIARDMADRTSLPLVVWQGRVRADFLLRGITEPTPSDCVIAWWKERADGVTHR
jgi:hypothetical protein